MRGKPATRGILLREREAAKNQVPFWEHGLRANKPTLPPARGGKGNKDTILKGEAEK